MNQYYAFALVGLYGDECFGEGDTLAALHNRHVTVSGSFDGHRHALLADNFCADASLLQAGADQECAVGTEIAEAGVFASVPYGEQANDALVALQEHFVDGAGNGGAILQASAAVTSG